MKYFLYSLIFILGACIISFLKVIAYDYPQISFTRSSHCDYCGRILRWFEIIPIIGYFIVHGKCSQCKNQIDFQNPFWEFIGGVIWLIIVHSGAWYYLPIFVMLVLLSFTDGFFGYIYPIFYLISLPSLIWLLPNLHIITGLSVYIVLWLLAQNHPLGLGDVEIIAVLSLLFNLQTILSIVLLACFFCLLAFAVNKKRSFRFIPYLAVATGIIYLIFQLKLWQNLS